MKSNELGLLLPEPTARDSKYSRGTVGFITGSDAFPGAALLGVAGAQATSPGFVRFVGPRRVADLMLLAHPEVVVTSSFDAAGPAQAWVVGSGVTLTAEDQLNQISKALQSVPVAVIDAGALELIGAIDKAGEGNHILTPHQGELCRLLNRLNPEQFWHPEQLDNPQLARKAVIAAVELTGQTVLLKGAKTLVASPEGDLIEIGPNSHYLATAGTGDVLAGVLGGIAAQNPEVAAASWMDISRLAVELHSSAAEISRERGAVTASSVASCVAQAISRRFHR